MNLTDAFKAFDATPTNIRWSTVAPRSDGSIVAVLWDDELKLDRETRLLVHDSHVEDWGGLVMLPVIVSGSVSCRLHFGTAQRFV